MKKRVFSSLSNSKLLNTKHMKKLLLLITILAVTLMNVKADHYAGAEITYQFV